MAQRNTTSLALMQQQQQQQMQAAIVAQQHTQTQHTSAHAAAAAAAAGPVDSSRRMSYSAQGTHQQDEDEEQLIHYQQEEEQDAEADADVGMVHADSMDHAAAMAAAAQQHTQQENAQTIDPKSLSSESTVAASASAGASGSVVPSDDVLDDDLASATGTQTLARLERLLGVDWELHTDICRDMHKKEKKYRVFNGEAKYLKHRRIIVDWMCEVGEEYKLSPLTIHCSVRYLDRLLGEHDVPKAKLQLVAMACILIAAKYEEAEDVIPTLMELNECSNNAYSIDSIKEMEVGVLRSLQWSLTVINPIHFLAYYQARGIVFENDLFEGGPHNRRSALKYVRKYADFFAELSLQEYTFQQYLPSVMSAAVVAAARRAVKIDPIWNAELESLTGYNASQIFKAYKHMYSYYTESFPTAPHCNPSPSSVLQFEEKAQRNQQQSVQAY